MAGGRREVVMLLSRMGDAANPLCVLPFLVIDFNAVYENRMLGIWHILRSILDLRFLMSQ